MCMQPKVWFFWTRVFFPVTVLNSSYMGTQWQSKLFSQKGYLQLLEQTCVNSPLQGQTKCLYSASNGSISMFLLFDTMMDYLFTEQHWWPENLIFMPANPWNISHWRVTFTYGKGHLSRDFLTFCVIGHASFPAWKYDFPKVAEFEETHKDLESYFLSVCAISAKYRD